MWPLGKEAMVQFSPHDSHTSGKDVYPPAFPVNVKAVIDMAAGIVSDGHMSVAYPGRKKGGFFTLTWHEKGYPGSHGSRHLCNMMGGAVYSVDKLFMRPDGLRSQSASDFVVNPSDDSVVLRIPDKELSIVAWTLDHLPWTNVSWSMHRGLKDILLAVGKPVLGSGVTCKRAARCG
jgi:hypothetical protein